MSNNSVESSFEFFGLPVHAMTMQKTIELIRTRINSRIFTQHCVVNVAKVVACQSDIQLAASVRDCHIVNIDGMGVVWGARWLGHAVQERVAGIDLFCELLRMSAQQGLPVFLLGATQDVVTSVAARVVDDYPGLIIAGAHHGYFWSDEAAVVNRIRESGARLLFVAITSPKKENFINTWGEQLGADFVMGVGGSFDVLAGKVKRAPAWMQHAGLEWLYRVLQEPRRMWRRYFDTNLRFLVLILKAKLGAKH
jgi:N-acetylglucosaminyldiphosphoundecaprenol N-acetyl-beta-D-mannosaminyltransferase